MKKNLLDSISVKSPCNESWDEMVGNDTIRFCSHCAKNVHNISAITRTEAERLIRQSNGNLCVRYVKNPNGKPVTAPPKLTQIKRQATIAAGVLATSLTFSTLAYAQGNAVFTKENQTQTQPNNSQNKAKKQTFSTVSGTVKDSEGAVIANAKIILRDIRTTNTRLTVSNEDGFYEFKNVEPSTYEIQIESIGFEKLTLNNVEILKDIKFDNVMKVGEFLMGIIVTSEPIEFLPNDIKINDEIELQPVQVTEKSKKKKKKK